MKVQVLGHRRGCGQHVVLRHVPNALAPRARARAATIEPDDARARATLLAPRQQTEQRRLACATRADHRPQPRPDAARRRPQHLERASVVAQPLPAKLVQRLGKRHLFRWRCRWIVQRLEASGLEHSRPRRRSDNRPPQQRNGLPCGEPQQKRKQHSGAEGAPEDAVGNTLGRVAQDGGHFLRPAREEERSCTVVPRPLFVA